MRVFHNSKPVPLVTLEAIRQAANRLRGAVRRTPVLDVSVIAGRPLVLKCENQQRGGAFKLRGAMNMLLRLSAEERARGVITYSSGNHGQAVALAASRLGIPAVVVMPTTAPAVKVEGVRRWGADVLFAGRLSEERRARAEVELEARGLVMVPPFDHPWIVEGQGTCGLEILDQVPDAAVVVAPVGGGGLLAGVSAAVKLSTRGVSVVGVEPSGAAKMTASIRAGHPVTLDQVDTIADGLMAVRPGDLTFAHVQAYVDRMIVVEDRAIARAAWWLFSDVKLVAEPSGAAALAAVLWPQPDSPLADRTRKVVAIISGGNVAPETLVELREQWGNGAMGQ
jgi:threonine dehydratase